MDSKLFSHSVTFYVVVSTWSYLVCFGTFLWINNGSKFGGGAMNAALTRSFLLLGPWVQKTECILPVATYVTTSEILLQEENLKNRCIR